MAHFAQLDKNNVVINVVKVADHMVVDENGTENEQVGINYLKGILGGHKWIQTSYNNNIRHRYAAIGGTYHEELDAFTPRKPFNSWILDETTIDWICPVPKPEGREGFRLEWDDANVQWIYVELPPPPEPEIVIEPEIISDSEDVSTTEPYD